MILLCDTSPQAMVLPTGIFDFLQESQDFYLQCSVRMPIKRSIEPYTTRWIMIGR